MLLFSNLLLEVEQHIAVLTVNRPAKLNALNSETIGELTQAIAHCIQQDDIRGIIITGTGEKAFVAGADIQEFVTCTADQAAALSRVGHVLMDSIQNASIPIIAAVNGFALGGGLELALACHLRIASDNAQLGLPEVSLGIIPGYGGTQRLPQLVGKGKALEMILTGDAITAADALSWGLVNHVVPQAELLDFSKKILLRMLSRSAAALATAIHTVHAGYEHVAGGFEMEIRMFGESFATDEAAEGIAAFIEKRKHNF